MRKLTNQVFFANIISLFATFMLMLADSIPVPFIQWIIAAVTVVAITCAFVVALDSDA